LENGSRDRGDRGREEAWGMLTSVLGRDWGLVRTRGSGAFESDWTGADDETRWKALPDLSRIYKPHLPLLFPSPHARRRCTPTATNREKKCQIHHHRAPRFPRGHHEFPQPFFL
jgi:hypothetical protein